MSDLLTRLQTDMKTAMKAGEKDRLQVIRMLISEVKNIDLNPAKPTAEQAVEAYAKKLKKSAEEFEKIGRAEEVAKLKAETEQVEAYLPKKLSAAETEPLVDAFLAANAFTEKDAGRATGAFMKQHAGQVDAGIVNPLIRQKLAGK
ncbi:MAG: GatB/YqeY domain-containing protein [Tepidisphaeraceae bacterium]